jgi:hypothetical protein
LHLYSIITVVGWSLSACRHLCHVALLCLWCGGGFLLHVTSCTRPTQNSVSNFSPYKKSPNAYIVGVIESQTTLQLSGSQRHPMVKRHPTQHPTTLPTTTTLRQKCGTDPKQKRNKKLCVPSQDNATQANKSRP